MSAWASSAQKKFTISGYISDATSGERLRNASVIITNKNAGTTSNEYGFFSITLPSDSIDLVITYSGKTSFASNFFLKEDVQLDVKLESLSNLNEVVVTSKKSAIQNQTQMSKISIPVETIKSLPRFLGEVDIMRAIQMLPGIQAGSEGQSGIYVRGGGPDQNLILLDGVPVYNASHLFGFFSVFNADAVKSVDVIKGGFPARYGGRLSSVVDIQMKEGANDKLHGEGGIGLIASRLTLEGPFKKGKESSFMISGRRTYIDLLAMPFILASTEGVKTGYFFYDLNAKANFKLNDKNHLYLSGYLGNDKFYANESYDGSKFKNNLHWGNATTVARWNHLFNKKTFGNLTASYTRYLFDISSEEKNSGNQNFYLHYFSGINDLSVKYDLDYLPNPNHFLKAGVSTIFHTFKPGAFQQKDQSGGYTWDTTLGQGKIHTKEYEAYIEDDIKLSNKVKLNAGLHFTLYQSGNKTYSSLQPRFSTRYLLTPQFSIKASYARMNQYIHLLSNSGIGLPTDLWVPVTPRVPPQVADQLAAGLAYSLHNKYEFSVEAYYKKMNNVLEYKEGSSYISPFTSWEDNVTVGKGDSYGAEFFAQRQKGKLTGMLGYTLSWTNRIFDELNFGKKFPYRYDRRHDFKIAGVYKISERIELSTEFVYGTGQAITLPEQVYQTPGGNEIEVNGGRNAYRMPAYHRMDFAASFSKQKKRHMRTWVFSIYNVYNRKNSFYIYRDTRMNGDPVFKSVSVFPILPSFSYQFKF